jgi:C-terminal processing protease CtpA/Prc
MRRRNVLSWTLFVVLSLSPFGFTPRASAQTVSGSDRATARMMLHNLKDELKKKYFDPKFRGVNIDERFKAAEERLEQATSNGQLFGIIAQAMLSLNDSHTFFVPPQRTTRIDYGWRTQMVGDKCYITAVKPGTDAEAKGLKPGDILHVVDGYSPTRENFWLLNYLYNVLQPRPSLSVVVQGPGEQPRKVDFAASVRQGKKILDLTSGSGLDFFDLVREGQERERITSHRFHEAGKEVLVWSMPQFDLSRDEVDKIMDRARNFKALIIDLRENSGGYEETVLRLVGNLFDRDVKIGDLKRRNETKPLVAKSRGGNIFQGALIVLVDSSSASASELLARVVQLEKRGTVVGDRTAGAVMRSKGYYLQIGVGTIIPYGASITDADVVMSDGGSLERVGVTPDKLMLPTGADMRAASDPVLAYAASLAGVKIESEKAGALFPIRWKLKP